MCFCYRDGSHFFFATSMLRTRRVTKHYINYSGTELCRTIPERKLNQGRNSSTPLSNGVARTPDGRNSRSLVKGDARLGGCLSQCHVILSHPTKRLTSDLALPPTQRLISRNLRGDHLQNTPALPSSHLKDPLHLIRIPLPFGITLLPTSSSYPLPSALSN